MAVCEPTLDLDERLPAAARARARAQHTTLGSAVSALGLVGLAHEDAPGQPQGNGLVLPPGTPGRRTTDDMVADALADN